MTTAAATAATNSNSILNNYLTQQAQQQATATAAANAASSTAGGIGNLNTFLTILTTQLKNQDPTAATDTNQFTQELVQFAGVEQQLNTNTDLSTLINLQQNSNGLTATLGYIGKYVEVPSTTQVALQSSSAEIGYNLPSSAANATVTILNSSGQTVATLSGGTNSGMNYITWNGQSSDGTQEPDGAYTFQVNATDTTGNAISITDTRSIGLVTSVASNSNGTVNLSLGSGMTTTTTAIDAVYTQGNLPASTAPSS